MTPLRSPEIAAFSAALERVHMLTDSADFPDRVFEVLESLVPGVFITIQELNTLTGKSQFATNQPTPAGLMERCSELIPFQHPVFPAVVNGARGALRLHDFCSHRQFRRTDLYQETFKPLSVRNQIVVPLIIPNHVAGLTINRDLDFTDDEVCLASLLAPHLALAHHRAQQITSLKTARRTTIPSAESLKYLGLTTREAETLHWIIQGKRDGEISEILGVSIRTIEKHVQSILQKLSVETRTAAAVKAIEIVPR